MHTYWGMLSRLKARVGWEGDMRSPFSSATLTVASSIFAGTCNFCTHFTEQLQFADSAANCFLMLLPLGSGVLWIGCFFTFILCLYHWKKKNLKTQHSNANFCRCIWVPGGFEVRAQVWDLIWLLKVITLQDDSFGTQWECAHSHSCTCLFPWLSATTRVGALQTSVPCTQEHLDGEAPRCTPHCVIWWAEEAELHLWDQIPTWFVQSVWLFSISWLTWWCPVRSTATAISN